MKALLTQQHAGRGSSAEVNVHAPSSAVYFLWVGFHLIRVSFVELIPGTPAGVAV